MTTGVPRSATRCSCGGRRAEGARKEGSSSSGGTGSTPRDRKSGVEGKRGRSRWVADHLKKKKYQPSSHARVSYMSLTYYIRPVPILSSLCLPVDYVASRLLSTRDTT